MDVTSAPPQYTGKPSPFLDHGPCTSASSLTILHLRRDLLIPTLLQETRSNETADYAEGSVTNTRFGSYPHSTLLDLPWGSQVLASVVDTGSRGRKTASKKRKLEEFTGGDEDDEQGAEDNGDSASKKQKTAVAASSGFCHVLPPTPESWTISLPHRTQVVYTPDYSYILQKLKVRPGSVVIEAGAGSGSFTHAAARAVHNGTPTQHKGAGSLSSDPKTHSKRCKAYGKVFSFEYHEPRSLQLQEELKTHGLDSIVRVTHRDVYHDGFMLASTSADEGSTSLTTSPSATAVFLDLPAPWNALPHLKRSSISPLSPSHAIHLCCFLPCIEQVQRAVTSLRQHGWVEINMQELQHRRLEVRREKVGLEWEGLRGVNASPKDVTEAVQRLKEVKGRARNSQPLMADYVEPPAKLKGDQNENKESRAERLARVAKEAEGRKTFKEGLLVHRTEPDVKNHTSYLVFAVLPMEWKEGNQ